MSAVLAAPGLVLRGHLPSTRHHLLTECDSSCRFSRWAGTARYQSEPHGRGPLGPLVHVRPVTDDQWEIVAWLWESFRQDLAVTVNGLPYGDGRYQTAPVDPYPSSDGAAYLAWRPHLKTGEDAPVAFRAGGRTRSRPSFDRRLLGSSCRPPWRRGLHARSRRPDASRLPVVDWLPTREPRRVRVLALRRRYRLSARHLAGGGKECTGPARVTSRPLHPLVLNRVPQDDPL